MNHLQSESLLAEFASGSLAGPQAAEVEEHANRCLECREWLETYSLLEASLEAGDGDSGHPSADEIARYALHGGEPDIEVVEHLADCRSCRREVELARSSTDETRLGEKPPFYRQARRVSLPLRLGVAAAALTAVVVPLWLARTPASTEGHHQLTGRSLRGKMTVTAGRSITVTETEVATEADVTLRAGDAVALGNGFFVDSEAILTVETTGTQPDA